ncbi:perlucin-like [Diorhabda carinulata]|uniref:perlucin-like n=1 Tax=Diorhabda carinulata TaxID=1163345 RepID=UPI0025A28948|nr:perlucin-like [Diorhabda carinulata]
MFVKFLAIFCTIFVIVYGQDEVVSMDSVGYVWKYDKPSETNLYHHGNKSFYIGNVFKGNFLHSEQFCKYHGMSLATIESQEENDFLESKLIERGVEGVWLFTSGTRLPNNVWVWLATGKNIAWTNWKTGEPNNVNSKEECIAVNLINKQMEWYDINCWTEQYFVCQETSPLKCIE